MSTTARPGLGRPSRLNDGSCVLIEHVRPEGHGRFSVTFQLQDGPDAGRIFRQSFDTSSSNKREAGNFLRAAAGLALDAAIVMLTGCRVRADVREGRRGICIYDAWPDESAVAEATPPHVPASTPSVVPPPWTAKAAQSGTRVSFTQSNAAAPHAGAHPATITAVAASRAKVSVTFAVELPTGVATVVEDYAADLPDSELKSRYLRRACDVDGFAHASALRGRMLEVELRAVGNAYRVIRTRPLGAL